MKSIRGQMIFYLVVFSVVTFSIFGVFLVRQIDRLPEHIESQNQEIVNAKSREVSKELQGTLDSVEMLAQSSLIQSMDMDAIKAFLPTVVLEGKIRNMTISDTDGVAWSTYDEEYIDISEQDQFKSIILEGNKTHISNPFDSPFVIEDVPIVTVSHAIIDDSGETIGLLNAVISIQFLNEIIEAINYQGSGYAYIINETGYIVAYPDSEYNITNHVSSWIPNDSNINTLLNNEEGVIHYTNGNGNEEVAFFSTISSVDNWTFVLTLNQTEVYSIYNSVFNYFRIAFTVFLVAILLFAVVYSTTISKPISNLIKTFETAAKGDLSVKAVENSSNELGLAGKSFNQMINKIKELTYKDTITNTYNLNTFMIELNQRVLSAKSEAYKCAIIIISIDDFKRINSIGGYTAGNEVLKLLAEKIQSTLTNEELLGRYYGDELILFIKRRNQSTIKNYVEILYTKLSESITINSSSYNIDTSVGVSFIDYQSKNHQDAIHQATLAKLNAKRSNEKNITYFNKTISDAIIKEQALEEALHHALQNNEFYVVYQPIHQSDSERIVGFEALLRWNHPDFMHTDVLTWIQILERKGLIHGVGEWVLETVTNQIVSWNKNHNKAYFISVNVSPLQLEHHSFVEKVASLIKVTNIKPSLIHIEITETHMMDNTEEKIKTLNELKSLGVSIALDDFGTGYSSLSYVMQLPIDNIKIDRSFIMNMLNDEKSLTIVKTITALAKTMRVSITAEGVETINQFNKLKTLNCQYYQGYYFNKPLKKSMIEDLLMKG